jgi:uncharacterized membrane protein
MRPDAAPQQHAQNVETIVSLRTRAEEQVNRHQRGIERLTVVLGRPGTVYAIVGTIAAWMTWNAALTAMGRPAWDPPPFSWLQGLIGLSALLMTTFVLTTQNRQGKLDEQRSHLDLQINLLSEQKAAKIIELLEELRRDLPNVRNRVDQVAEVMQEAADPGAVMSALEEIERPGEGGAPGG